MTTAIHPDQFQVNEAWIAFFLNESPIETEQDGSFNCVCLMDAASCFILSTAMIMTDVAEPSEIDARRLFKLAQAHDSRKPKTLFVPIGHFQNHIAAEARRRGIELVPMQLQDLLACVGEARQGFAEHLQGGAGE